MTDATCFLAPPDPDEDKGRKVECRALVCVGGRPSLLTPEIAEKICDLFADGMKIKEIAAIEGMPKRSTIRLWIKNNLDFRAELALAREEFADDTLRDTIDISDDSGDDNELVEGADGMPVVRPNKESVPRSALRIETRFRALAKMMPRKYGDDAAALAAPAQAEPQRNGDDAKVIGGTQVIDGTVIPIDQHPLYEAVQAWGKVAREAVKK